MKHAIELSYFAFPVSICCARANPPSRPAGLRLGRRAPAIKAERAGGIMARNSFKLFVAAGPMALLAACGGGGGEGISSTPPPPAAAPAPTPTPTSTPTPPPPVLAPANIGLISNQSFKTLSLSHSMESGPMSDVESTPPTRSETLAFRYNSAENIYEITLPGFAPGRLQTEGLNGTSGRTASSTFNRVTLGAGPTLQAASVTLQVPGSSFSPFTYTSLANWEGAGFSGVFAYGIATAPGEVPLSGSAGYSANVVGATEYDVYVGGFAKLQFDFAAGTLSGFMQPMISDGWDLSIDPGRYDFTQTIFAAGRTDFSGSFVVPGLPNAQSYFEGSFTGPQAAELMARWQAPSAHGSMFGVWVGKKD